MGYDSSIIISKEDINKVENILISQGFEKYDRKLPLGQIAVYSKYIDDLCKYKEGTNFIIIKHRGKYSVWGRNSAWCTGYDLKLHNDSLIFLAKSLGKEYETDYGSNVPFQIHNLTYGMVNALAFPFGRLENEFNELIHMIGCVLPLNEQQKSFDKIFNGYSFLNQESFSSNILLIYIVSVLENYFKNTFQNILKCLSKNEIQAIETRMNNYPRYAKTLYREGKIDKIQLITSGYSFQNIDSIILTYKNCLDIDLEPLFNKNTFLKRRRYDIFKDFFTSRHQNIHQLKYEYRSLNTFIKQLTVISKTLNDIYLNFCHFYNVETIEELLPSSSYKNVLKHIETFKMFQK